MCWLRRKPDAYPSRDWTVKDTGGRQAREKAERDLAKTRQETEKYARLAADLREIGARNHLAVAFIIAARGRRHD